MSAPIAGWHTSRDRDTGVVAELRGGGVPAPGAVADPAIAERAARAFVAAHLGDLAPGATGSDFVVVANRLDGSIRTVAFAQMHRGLRVVGAGLHVVFRRDRLFALGSTAVPVPAGRPALAGNRVVLPLVYGPGDLALPIVEPRRDGDWIVYVAAGREVRRESRVRHATSTLRYDVPERRPTSTRVLTAAPSTNITVGGSAVVTSSTGTFTTGNNPTSVATSVTGTLVRVVTATGAPATATLTAQPNQPLDWSVAADELADAQVTAYIYGNVAKARARTINPGLAWLDQQLLITVNEAGECNAQSGGDDLRFFRGSQTCENTARLSDVVLHEFGHSLHFQSIIPGAGEFEIALSEGLSDFFAAHVLDDPGVGRGLHFDDTPARDLDPVGSEARFPEDISGDEHITGLIIAGALWDLRTRLFAELGQAAGTTAIENIYLGILQRAPNITGSYQAALIADDDDGNLGNGTPHLCAIEDTFVAHGLVPGFTASTLATPVVNGRDVRVTAIPATASGCPHAQITGVELAWQIGDGAAQTIAMIADGDTYAAAIPPQPNGTVVRYQLTAQLDDGSTIVMPKNAADPLYQLFVGDATPIFCDRLDVDPRWEHTGNEWEYARPFGRAGDPPVTFSGEAFLGTDIIHDGGYVSDNTSSIITPPIEAAGFDRFHLQFRRWLTVEARVKDLATIEVDGEPVWANASGVEHVDREWRFVDVELAAGTHQIAWTLATDATGQLGGWNIDDICVVGIDGPAECVDCPDPSAAGCCSTSRDNRGTLVLGLVVLVALRRRRT